MVFSKFTNCSSQKLLPTLESNKFKQECFDQYQPKKSCIQLFRESLSEKVQATILNGIVGGFEFTVLQRNLKELARKAMKMCLWALKESNKSRVDSYSRQEQCIEHIPYYLSGLSRVHFFRQPFSKQLYTLKQASGQLIRNHIRTIHTAIQVPFFLV